MDITNTAISRSFLDQHYPARFTGAIIIILLTAWGFESCTGSHRQVCLALVLPSPLSSCTFRWFSSLKFCNYSTSMHLSDRTLAQADGVPFFLCPSFALFGVLFLSDFSSVLLFQFFFQSVLCFYPQTPEQYLQTNCLIQMVYSLGLCLNRPDGYLNDPSAKLNTANVIVRVLV